MRSRVKVRRTSCRFGARVCSSLPALTLSVASAIGLVDSQQVAAAPVLDAQLTQTCAGCGLAGPPFPTLGGVFVSAAPPQFNKNLFQSHSWPIRQSVVVFPPMGSAETLYVRGGTARVQGRAIAVPGGLGILAQNNVTAASMEENAASSGTVASHAQARFQLNDNLITGPLPPGTTIPVTLNLLVNGLISVNAAGTGGFGGTVSRADLLLDFTLAGARHVGTIQLQMTNQLSGSGVTVNGTGLLEGLEGEVLTGNLNAHIPISLTLALPFSAPVNVPFSTDFFGRAQTSGSFNLGAIEGGWLHHTGGLVNVAHTVSFPTGSPVLDLPAGFTFNSVDGQVVDNMWQGSLVPEPASWLLMSLGLAMAVFRCRQRLTRHSDC